ncbi:cytochrome c oxidase subunit II [Novosphingobium sp. MD-1]|uniref:cytochrome c oxidase subunit II n=1 Tax=Novosphingobium sp. MD-1 TaxID=1630648 RepID=UPI001F2F8D8F|nr:cytochrome c oxidase subunit II [Novosphingobium sp. MD-1]
MSLADTAQAMGKAIRALGVAAALAFAPQVMAAPAAAPVAAATAPAADAVQPAAKADAGAEKSSYVPAKPTPGKGQPVAGALSFQDQYSITGQQALRMYDYVLMPIITVITLFVLVLLLFVMARFRRGANPVASKTSHNTLIEVIWTLLPVLILVVIAVPSIRLLAAQYTPAPKNALTVKATGYQWYWGYTYPDNGGFEVISNMLPDEEALKRGEPPQLGADARMVVPYGEPIRMQTVGADVIHSFAVPSLWFKLDAVPGRINEKELFIKEPGVYYGQCSELCGVRHGYMPIVVEAVSRPQFEAWVKAQGGTVGPKEAAPAAAPAAAAPAADASAPAADASASPAA